MTPSIPFGTQFSQLPLGKTHLWRRSRAKFIVAVLDATLGDEGSEQPLPCLRPPLWWLLKVEMFSGVSGYVLEILRGVSGYPFTGEDSREVSENSVVSET